MHVSPDTRDERVTALEHALGEMREALHLLTEFASPAPVHPPAMASTSPVVDLPAGRELESGDLIEDMGTILNIRFPVPLSYIL